MQMLNLPAWLMVTLLASRVASAGDVVLTPLLADGTVNAKQTLGVHQLLAAELDFSPEVQGVIELATPPPGLNDKCLVEPACLGSIAATSDGDKVFTGRMKATGSSYELDLVYFDNGRIQRRRQFLVPQDPTDLANRITPVMREMLTGDSGLQRPTTVADLGLDEDIDVGPLSDLPEPADPLAPEPTIASLNFGGSADDLRATELEKIQFGTPPGVELPSAREAPPPPPSEDPVDRIMSRMVDFDSDDGRRERRRKEPRTKTVRSSASRSEPSGGASDAERQRVQITVRGGYSNYYKFDFLTGGAEGAVRLTGGLHVMLGLEVYAVKRIRPPSLQLEDGKLTEWNTIFPINAGAMYELAFGPVEPYLGADAILVQYFQDEQGSDWAGGARARLGMDIMIVENLGINLNFASGAWLGKNWGIIEPGVPPFGFLPQVSGGIVVAL